MRRREFLAGLALSLVAQVAGAQQQPVAKVPRIAMLCSAQCAGTSWDALMTELKKLGLIEGSNILVERMEARGQLERLPELADEIVRSKPDLIIAASPQPNRAVKNATAKIPIVMIAVADPVGAGLAQSLARPGGNVTGVATLVPGGFIAKQVELLRELLPEAKQLAALVNPTNEIHRLQYPVEVPPAAARLGFALRTFEVRSGDELASAVAAVKAEGTQALLVVGDPIFHAPPNRIPDLAAAADLPAIYLPRDLVLAGGLVSFGPDFVDMFRRAAHYADRVLKGANPAELPIEQPTKFELVINLRTAKTLGLTVPQSLLARADEVIE